MGEAGVILGILAFVIVGVVVAIVIFPSAQVLAVMLAANLPGFYLYWLLGQKCKYRDTTRGVLIGLCAAWMIFLPFLVNPLLSLGALVLIAFILFGWWHDDPWFLMNHRYKEIVAQIARTERITPAQFSNHVSPYDTDPFLPQGDEPLLMRIASGIYAAEYQEITLPPAPVFTFRTEVYDGLSAKLDEIGFFLQGDKIRAKFTMRYTTLSFAHYFSKMPPIIPGSLKMRATDALQDKLPSAVYDAVNVFRDEDAVDMGVGRTVLEAYARKQDYISSEEQPRGGSVSPFTTTGNPVRFLWGTPLEPFTNITVSFGIPSTIRPQHGVIIGGSGAGKSVLIEALVYDDLLYDDPPGIVLIDSKGGKTGLVERIARHRDFHPDTGKYRDRLIVIDPKDTPALGLFSGATTNDEIEAKIDQMRYFFESLMGSGLSGQMDALFAPLMHIMFRLDNPTLSALRTAVTDFDPQHEPYRNILPSIPDGSRGFLERYYNDKGNTYSATKMAIATRLSQIVNRSNLDQIFGATVNRFDMRKAIDGGKIVLIQTGNLGAFGPLFGRYFIDQLYQAASARGDERSRVHFYVDEAEQYIDATFKDIFNKLRSYNVGATIAFQYAGQMGSMSETIRANTAFQFLGSVSPDDARSFARQMGRDPEFIEAQKVGIDTRPPAVPFACMHSGLKKAVAIGVPTGLLDKVAMDEADYERLRENNRLLISARPSLDAPSEARPPRSRYPLPDRKRTPAPDPDDIDVSLTPKK